MGMGDQDRRLGMGTGDRGWGMGHRDGREGGQGMGHRVGSGGGAGPGGGGMSRDGDDRSTGVRRSADAMDEDVADVGREGGGREAGGCAGAWGVPAGTRAGVMPGASAGTREGGGIRGVDGGERSNGHHANRKRAGPGDPPPPLDRSREGEHGRVGSIDLTREPPGGEKPPPLRRRVLPRERADHDGKMSGVGEKHQSDRPVGAAAEALIEGIPFVEARVYGSAGVTKKSGSIQPSYRDPIAKVYHTLRGQVTDGGAERSQSLPSMPPLPPASTQFQTATINNPYHVLAIQCPGRDLSQFAVIMDDRGFVYVRAEAQGAGGAAAAGAEAGGGTGATGVAAAAAVNGAQAGETAAGTGAETAGGAGMEGAATGAGVARASTSSKHPGGTGIALPLAQLQADNGGHGSGASAGGVVGAGVGAGLPLGHARPPSTTQPISARGDGFELLMQFPNLVDEMSAELVYKDEVL